MLVEIDSNFLVRNNLTVKQYIFLYLIYQGAHYQLLKYLKIDPIDLTFGQNLVDKGWIEGNINSITSLKVTKQFTNFFIIKDYFQELVDLFPTSVTRQDGTKVYLRTAQKECRTRYNRIIKNSKIKHDAIITALKAEINTRTKNNNMMWFKTMPSWLKSEEWKTYEGVFENGQTIEEMNTPKNTYGTNIL